MKEKAKDSKKKRIDELRKRFAAARFGKTERTNSFLKNPITFNSEQPEP